MSPIIRFNKIYSMPIYKQLKYRLAINNDFITPLYDRDNEHYIYTGTIGNLLPVSIFTEGKYIQAVHRPDISPNFIVS